MTVIELVRETVEYYKDHLRGIKYNDKGINIGCHYHIPETGAVCAVGRCFNEEGLQDLGHHTGSVDEAKSDVEDGENGFYSDHSFYDYFKPKYQDIGIQTLEKLQMLHDEDSYWAKYKQRKGFYLTPKGKSFISSKFQFNIDRKDGRF